MLFCLHKYEIRFRNIVHESTAMDRFLGGHSGNESQFVDSLNADVILVQAWERLVMKKLKWDLFVNTPNHFVQTFGEHLPMSTPQQNHVSKCAPVVVRLGYLKGEYSSAKKLFEHVMILLCIFSELLTLCIFWRNSSNVSLSTVT